jgi:hypothetical protein
MKKDAVPVTHKPVFLAKLKQVFLPFYIQGKLPQKPFFYEKGMGAGFSGVQ